MDIFQIAFSIFVELFCDVNAYVVCIISNGVRFVGVCSMAHSIAYLGECSMCAWKEYVFCYYGLFSKYIKSSWLIFNDFWSTCFINYWERRFRITNSNWICLLWLFLSLCNMKVDILLNICEALLQIMTEESNQQRSKFLVAVFQFLSFMRKAHTWVKPSWITPAPCLPALSIYYSNHTLWSVSCWTCAQYICILLRYLWVEWHYVWELL